MESIGQKLKTAREEKGYSPDQVARDTNIARRFILAMEGEDYSVFPGDTYLLGFLRNYADYLGLDSERIISLYRNMRIQEQPIPMEELLLAKKKSPPLSIVLLIVVALGVLGGGGYGLYTLISRSSTAEAEAVPETASAEPSGRGGARYEMVEELVARRFQEGQEIAVHLDEGTPVFTIESIGEKVILQSAAGKIQVTLGKTVTLDLTLDGREDLAVEVQDLDARGRTAVLRLDRGIGGPENLVEEEVTGEILPPAGSSTVADRQQSPVIIREAPRPEPFRLDVVFRGYSLLRYLRDGELREQKYFNKDETLRLNVNREVMLWISNAGSLNARIAGEEVDLGGPGEVSTKLIRWEEDSDSGRYQLKLLPVY